jgi:hypothetical protein
MTKTMSLLAACREVGVSPLRVPHRLCLRIRDRLELLPLQEPIHQSIME